MIAQARLMKLNIHIIILIIIYVLYAHAINEYAFACTLLYAETTVFQLYHCGDMMYKMRRRKPEPTFLPT